MKDISLFALSCVVVWGCAGGEGSLGSGGAGVGGGSGATRIGGVGGAGPSSSSSSGSSSTGAGNGGSGSGSSSSSSSSTSSSSGDPYGTPSTCSSNTYYSGGNGDFMQPGKPCKSCHVVLGQATGKTFDIGGTVYLTAHEPDGCNGVGVSGAQVVITDAQNQEHVLNVSSTGNFYHADLFGFAAFPPPYRAKVVYNGKERAMSTPQTSGDCNSCHTETGTSNAPGRIMLP